MRSYLQPVQVAQVVRLLQDGRSIHGSSVLRRIYLSCTVPGSELKHIGPSWSLFLTVWWETCTSSSAGGHFAILEELDWRKTHLQQSFKWKERLISWSLNDFVSYQVMIERFPSFFEQCIFAFVALKWILEEKLHNWKSHFIALTPRTVS